MLRAGRPAGVHLLRHVGSHGNQRGGKLVVMGKQQRFQLQVLDLRRSKSEQRQQLQGPQLPLSPRQGALVPPTQLRHG